MRKSLYITTLCLGSLLGSAIAIAETNLYDTTVCAPDGIALGGYDLVSYHQSGGPQRGLEEHAFTHNELRYLFASAKNRDAFTADIERYLPNYLGWCSTNLAMGRLACPDYTNFKIEDGSLLLFEHAGFTNGRDIWNSDPSLHKRQADFNFEKFAN